MLIFRLWLRTTAPGLGLLAAMASGCGSDACQADPAVGDARTIDRGIWGAVVTGVSDIDGQDNLQCKGHSVSVYRAASSASTPAVAETKTDERGFFELELAPAHYRICAFADSSNPQCAEVDKSDFGHDGLAELTCCRMGSGWFYGFSMGDRGGDDARHLP